MIPTDPSKLQHVVDAEAKLPDRDVAYVVTQLEQQWAGDDPRRWKALACFLLHRFCGMRLEGIGLAFAVGSQSPDGHHKGYISRLVRDCERQLQQAFTQEEIRDACERNKQQREARPEDD